ncbi:MAG: hypothetical protein MAG451_01379 [Anaerolineales bacterium]|nr:hypothetical protein [Anaerolineales bacterium]
MARNRQHEPTPAPTPTPTRTPSGAAPQFTCSDWCQPGSTGGTRRQTVTSDRAVDDWRAYVNDFLIGRLTEETSMRAILDAPEGLHVRIEAFYQGRWYVACESDVACPSAVHENAPASQWRVCLNQVEAPPKKFTGVYP